MNATTPDLTADIIDVRDIIARVEELQDALGGEDYHTDSELNDAQNDLNALTAILEELKDLGGDEQWEGHWYPVTLIRDSHFRTYAEELADDIDAVPKNAQWPLNCIDWEQAARELQWDYSAVDIDGVTYWYR